MLLLKYCLDLDNMDDCLKYVYTFIICFVNITFGMGLSSYGPSFVDLKYIQNTSMERISLFSFFLSAGYLLGSLFGFLYKYLNRQIVISVLIMFKAFSTYTVPIAPHISCLYICSFIIGTCAGAWSSCKTVWLIEIWQKKSAPVLHLCGFLFGIGTIIGPLIDECYVTGELHLDNKTTIEFNLTLNKNDQDIFSLNNTDRDSLYNQSIDRKSKLIIPFSIIGAMQFLGGLVMALMFFIRRYENKNHMISENQSQVSNELVNKKLFDKAIQTKCVEGYLGERTVNWFKDNSQRILLIGFVSAFLAFHMSSEVIYMQFSATYFQYIPLKFTAKLSALLMSSMALTFTIGRMISIFVALRSRPQNIIVIHLCIVFVGLFIIYFGQNSLYLVWTGAVTMSFGLSPIICSTYCFLAHYLDFKNRIGTVLLFSAESLTLCLPFVLGHFIEKYPQIFIFVLFINVLLSSLVFAVILFITNRAESRHRFLISK